MAKEGKRYIVMFGSECPFCGSPGEIVQCGPAFSRGYYWRCTDIAGCGAELRLERTYEEAARSGARRAGGAS